MKTSDFYYDLPPELIAQTPLERRDGSRLMTLDRASGAVGHHHFYNLPEFLRPGDCLILNDSRVLPARLLGRRLPGGGACEVLLLIDRGERTWECLVRPGRKMNPGAKLSFGDGQLTAEVVAEVEGASQIFNIVFFVTLVSLLLQGTTVVAASRRLGLTEQPEADESDFGVELDEALPTRLDARRGTDAMLASGNTLRDMRMPAGSLVMMVKRGKEYIVPNGNIELRRGDTLLIIKEN